MPKPGRGKLAAPVEKWAAQLGKYAQVRDAKNFQNQLFSNTPHTDDIASVTPDNLARLFSGNLAGIAFAGDFLIMLLAEDQLRDEAGSLQALASFIRRVAAVYAETEAEDGSDGEWLFPTLVHGVRLLRVKAASIDSHDGTTKWRKAAVEVLREVFPKLLKQKARLAGTCWLVCHLLSLYMALDQVKLCSHLLAALTHSLVREGGFDPESVPKSIAVTLYYYWGRYHVLEGKFGEAKDKLEWAFVHCHRDSKNKKRIAEYLIPCMIASGVFPKTALMVDCGMQHFVPLADAIKVGDVRGYNDQMTLSMQTLARSGTLILMEKCKLFCYRNLVKRAACVLREQSEDASKLDLDGIVALWNSLEDADRNETICALADLIYAGAVKGYLAPDHNKLVLSKASPFPPLDQVVG